MSSRDAILGGRVLLHQPARGDGYRANVDALLLASFAAGGPRARVAFDLGSGAGAIGLTLLRLDAAERLVFVELDPHAAELARTNVRENGFDARAEVVCADASDAADERGREAHLVVCNPPYFPPGAGRLPAAPARARARTGDLALFVRAARALCGRRARACFVYPARDLTRLLATLRGAGLEPKRLRAVHATRGAPARVVLVEAQAAKEGGLVVLPPWVEREGGAYGEELAALLSGAREG